MGQKTYKRSLAASQATRAVIAAVIIGLLLTLVEVGWATLRERSKVSQLIGQVLSLVEGGARTAVWSLDQKLAQQVAVSTLSMDAVSGVEIRLDDGRILWAEWRQGRPGRTSSFLGRWVFADLATGERVLHRPGAIVGSHPTVDLRLDAPVGLIRVFLDPSRISADYLAFVTSSLLSGLIRNLLLGLALTVVFHRFLTRPILAVRDSLAQLDPEKPGPKAIPSPAGHEEDELGALVDHVNATLDRLSNSQAALLRLATRDPLTGLPNRALLQERLTHAINRAARSGRQVAVMFLDLDRFKQVNDSLGHDAGDQLLQFVAQRLEMAVRESDTVGRLGGDEFLVIVEDVERSAEVVQIAERLLASVSVPLRLAGEAVHVGASIGIALHPQDGRDGVDLLRAADTAMYAAKSAGAGCWRLFSPDMALHALDRLRLESSLRQAMANAELELFFQPKVSPMDLRLLGAEALLRWRHNGAYVAPDEFIPVAEEAGLINEIGDWVLAETCRTAARWRAVHGDIPFSVNVSARQMTSALPARMAEILALTELPPALLTLEITESACLAQLADGSSTLSALRRTGVGLALDDFGTGFSSLSQLRRIPLTMLKIDRTFVADLPAEDAVAATIIELGRRLGVEVVAEGVESEAQRQWLAAAGCTAIQGFLITRPLPAAAFEAAFLDRAVERSLVQAAQ